MKRGVLIGGAALVVLVAAGALLAPTLVQKYAERQVDQALSRMRVQTTSVVNRGAVTVDIATRTLTVRDLTLESARREQRTRVGALIIVGPRTDDKLLKAERVTFEDVSVRSAGETVTAPRIEIENYSGPERGLTATPGVGRNARNQADLIGLVSLDRAVAPVVLFSGEQTAMRRTLRNLSVNRVVNGVVESATIDGVAVDLPYIPPDQSADGSSLALSAGPIVYQGVNLPTLWRFYAGDGKGDREPFLKSAVAANVQATVTLRPGGAVRASWKRLTVEDVKVRPLGYPVTTFDPFAAKFRLGGDTTPAELREQLLFGADGLRAVAFHRISLEGAKLEIARDGEEPRGLEIGAAEIGPYADGRLEAVKADRFLWRGAAGEKLALAHADARGFDAKGLLDYADRIGRDEALLNTRPTAIEIVRYAPRVASVETRGLDAAGGYGEVKASAAKAELDAPLDDVPQRVAIDVDDLDARPAPGTRPAELLSTMRLDALRGGLDFALVLALGAQTLTLERFDYRFEELGSLTGRGELTSLDPLIAVSTGAEFVDKFSAIEIGTFKFTFADDGAVETILRRAAASAGTPVELYREETARDAEGQISRLFGPPAENSAESAARFIRDPRKIEVTINPRGVSATLLDLIRAFQLGPAGIAQVLDVGVLYKR